MIYFCPMRNEPSILSAICGIISFGEHSADR